MNKNLFVYLYGFLLIVEGGFLLFEKHFTFSTIRFTLGITLIVGAIFALATFLTLHSQVQIGYHKMHALALVVYGISVLLFADTVALLSYLTAFLLFFYAFSEILFCIWIFNLRKKVKFKILLIRISLGFLVGISTSLLINYYTVNETIVMEGYGILLSIIGFNILLYQPIMKEKIAKD